MSCIGQDFSKDFLNEITPDLAVDILKILCSNNQNILKEVQNIAINKISKIDINEIANDVYISLDSIDVHDLWERSGPKYDGYHDPGEMAFEMFDQALKEYLDELKQYQVLKLPNEEINYCIGILKGIYLFDTTSTSEFKDWAVDAPKENFHILYDDYLNKFKNTMYPDIMKKLLKEHCPNWF